MGRRRQRSLGMANAINGARPQAKPASAAERQSFPPLRRNDSRPLSGAANRAALAHRRAKPVDRRCPRLPTGALPRNQLAYSVAGSASLISSKAARSSRHRRRVAAFPPLTGASGRR